MSDQGEDSQFVHAEFEAEHQAHDDDYRCCGDNVTNGISASSSTSNNITIPANWKFEIKGGSWPSAR